jgi:hypothetical protein
VAKDEGQFRADERHATRSQQVRACLGRHPHRSTVFQVRDLLVIEVDVDPPGRTRCHALGAMEDQFTGLVR